MLAPPNNINAWNTIAANVGCTSISTGLVESVACVRDKPLQATLKAVATAPAFGPTADEKLVFTNYTRQNELEAFSRQPMLLGSND